MEASWHPEGDALGGKERCAARRSGGYRRDMQTAVRGAGHEAVAVDSRDSEPCASDIQEWRSPVLQGPGW